MAFRNMKDVPLDQAPMGTVPDMSGALTDYYQRLVFEKLQKTVSGFEVVENPTIIVFRGMIQEEKPRELQMKPEGQRAWTWFRMHTDLAVTLEVDEVVIWNGVQTRVMSKGDYSIYGYMTYELVQDWQGSGP